jgi:hypothetical protein
MARTPVRVFRGTRLQKINKLENALKMIQRMDAVEQSSAAEKGTAPDLFIDRTPMSTAMQKMFDQCSALKSLKR